MSAAPLRKADLQPANLTEGEFAFTSDDFTRVAAMLYEDSGIHLSDGKVTLVYSRLAKRLRQLGLQTFKEYCELVSSDAGAAERRNMLSALTTNLPRFFREPHHFDHFRQQTLASVVDAARSGARLRFWSAGCSSGQEPYSMALSLLAVLPEAVDLDVRILATDIDPVIVGQARAGVYPDEAISAIPTDLRGRWLKREGAGQWSMGEAVRRLIVFNELNLMGSWPMKGRFQAIFCRNVAIYFEEPVQERLWSRFGDGLVEGGRLYVGHSERVTDPRFQNDGLTTYRLRTSK